jgi:carbamoyltransferase
LGPRFTLDEIAKLIEETGVTALDFREREDDLLSHAAELLTAGKVIGWFEGRMEFGPRALGARSILADPRDPGMRDRINALVKKREGFRPFAPAVLESKAAEHFHLDHASPFMLETCPVKSQLDLPAITHVDQSARVQTVNEIIDVLFLEDFVIDRSGLGSWEELCSSITAKLKTPSLVSDRVYMMM